MHILVNEYKGHPRLNLKCDADDIGIKAVLEISWEPFVTDE